MTSGDAAGRGGGDITGRNEAGASCDNSGGVGIGAGHECRCVRVAGHAIDSDRPHGCSCGALWADTLRRHYLTYYEYGSACRAGSDGDCFWGPCPQLRDDEPIATGRHCPLDALSAGADVSHLIAAAPVDGKAPAPEAKT